MEGYPRRSGCFRVRARVGVTGSILVFKVKYISTAVMMKLNTGIYIQYHPIAGPKLSQGLYNKQHGVVFTAWARRR